jgi:hypothetical protein
MNYHNAYRAVFPVEPMQTTYWLDGVELLSDIPKELANKDRVPSLD